MQESYYGWGLPIDVSTHGASIDRLIYVVHGLMFVLFVGWAAFLVIAIVRFRARKGHSADAGGHHFRLPTYLEIGVAVFEVVLLFVFSVPFMFRMKREFPSREAAVSVRVVAEQFAWNVHYPGRDGVWGRSDLKLVSATNPLGLDPDDPRGRDDITTINQLHVPVGKPVIVELSSKDVIHSFGIPVMRVKQDVIPGQQIPVWFEATRTGSFEIACAQLCGLGHYRMRGFFVVKTPEEFDAWLAEEEKKHGA
jgi:cytochrome c oxidase subunit 2